MVYSQPWPPEILGIVASEAWCKRKAALIRVLQSTGMPLAGKVFLFSAHGISARRSPRILLRTDGLTRSHVANGSGLSVEQLVAETGRFSVGAPDANRCVRSRSASVQQRAQTPRRALPHANPPPFGSFAVPQGVTALDAWRSAPRSPGPNHSLQPRNDQICDSQRSKSN